MTSLAELYNSFAVSSFTITTWCGYVQYSRVAYSILAIGNHGFSTQDLWQPETEWIYVMDN